MIILEFLRKYLFWTFDFLKGGHLRKHYNDIAFIQENFASADATKKRNSHLKNLLDHAVATVPYYQKQGVGSLDKFPIVSKAFIRENFEQFQSKSYLTKKNHKVMTSGSTGNPFTIFHDHNKRARNTVDTIYFSKKAGFEIGSRLYYLRLWDKQYTKSGFVSWVQNMYKHSVDDLEDDKILKLVHQLENDRSTKSILAYTSSLQSICKYLDRQEGRIWNFKVNTVIAVAEGLNDYVRTAIKKYFNCEVISRYSNSENGIIAQQGLASINTDFKINWASYYIEILDLNRDVPVEYGISGRIVITDLFNYSMPLIRYDTGDVGVLGLDTEDKDGALVLKSIDGRKMDMFTNTKGEFISSHIVHHILQVEEIDQFQFVQENYKDYILKLKVLKNFNRGKEQSLIKQYKDYFGEDANVKIEYVSDIPLLLSGKRKLVINKTLNAIGQNSIQKVEM